MERAVGMGKPRADFREKKIMFVCHGFKTSLILFQNLRNILPFEFLQAQQATSGVKS